jgi:hypothetical protein
MLLVAPALYHYTGLSFSGVCRLMIGWFIVLASLACLGLVTFSLREFYAWHLLISMSWVAAPTQTPTVRAVRIAFLLSAVSIVFTDSFAPNWLWMLYHADPR